MHTADDKTGETGRPVLRTPPSPAAAAKKASARQWITFCILCVVGGVIGFFGAKHGLELLVPVPAKAWKLVALAATPLVWLFVVGWHEGGHLVGGWATGGRFLLWVAGPLMVRRSPAGLKFVLNRTVNLAGGLAACLPRLPEMMTPRRAAVMIAGGPLSSLVLAVIALWVAALLADAPGRIGPARGVAQHVAMFTAGLSGLIFLVTALPGTAGGFKTDGKRVVDLLRGDYRSDQEAAMLVLTTASLAGVRPRDFPPALVSRATALRDGSLFDVYGHLTVYYHFADRKDWAQAQECLDHALAGEAQIVPYARDTIRCEYAWMLATALGPAAAPTARAWLDAAGKLEIDPATRLRAEAAVLAVEGRPMEAVAKVDAALHALEHRSLSPVRSAFVVEALEAIRRAASQL